VLTVWAFGSNEHGELGVLDTNDRHIPTWAPTLKHAMRVWCSTGYSFVLADNILFGFGNNVYHQLGLSRDTYSTSTPLEINMDSIGAIQDIVFGPTCTFFINPDGLVFGCGANNDGQLGLGKQWYISGNEPMQLIKGINFGQKTSSTVKSARK
jgi:alpha-tubulin suppressor-like RCC1 family protein